MSRSVKSKSRTLGRDREASVESPSNQSKEAHQSDSSQRFTNLIAVLRRITLAVQVFPFIYTAIFIFLFTAYSFSEGVVLDIIDYLSFVSPIVVVAHIVYSRMLKMCKWHRTACAIPLIPQAVDMFDNYVYHFEHNAWIVVSITIIVSFCLFLFCIYKVFYTDDGRIC